MKDLGHPPHTHTHTSHTLCLTLRFRSYNSTGLLRTSCQVTVSTHSDDVMRLVKECEETDKALAAEMVRNMPKEEKQQNPAQFLLKKPNAPPPTALLDKAEG